MAAGRPSVAGGLGGLAGFTELRRRLLFLLGAMVVFRIGTFTRIHVPCPGLESNQHCPPSSKVLS